MCRDTVFGKVVVVKIVVSEVDKGNKHGVVAEY